MQIDTARFLLRDLTEADRATFVAYQSDPRYRRLYDLDESYAHDASELFSLFLTWQPEEPRQNYQLGIIERRTGRLCGCAGLRGMGLGDGQAVLGIELAPDYWGRYRMALEVTGALIAVAFRDLGINRILGSTASGNARVERLALWFGAEIIAQRKGPDWMKSRNWSEVDWALSRSRWEAGGPSKVRGPVKRNHLPQSRVLSP